MQIEGEILWKETTKIDRLLLQQPHKIVTFMQMHFVSASSGVSQNRYVDDTKLETTVCMTFFFKHKTI